MEKITRLLEFVKVRASRETIYMSIYGAIVGWCLYRQWVMTLICTGILFFLSIWMPDRTRGHRQELRQTADILEAMASSISSGSSLPRAIGTACSQVEKMYESMGEKEARIAKMLRLGKMLGDTSGNGAFENLGKELKSSEIQAFAKALGILEIKGGNVSKLCLDTCDGLRKKCDLLDEVETLRTDMDLSRRILFLTVPAVVVMLHILAPEFMAPLYVGVGRLLSAGVFVVIVASWILSRKICKIE